MYTSVFFELGAILLGAISIPNQENNNASEGALAKKGEPSLLLSVTFAGLGTGFISFWLTLTFLYSAVLCAIGAFIVWLLIRGMKGDSFANRSAALFLVSALIGVGVGFGSSIGSGMPISIT